MRKITFVEKSSIAIHPWFCVVSLETRCLLIEDFLKRQISNSGRYINGENFLIIYDDSNNPRENERRVKRRAKRHADFHSQLSVCYI
jgi:hypothetical protein